MDKLEYYYIINKERIQHLSHTNQDYYNKWYNINEVAYKLKSFDILKNINDLFKFVQME